jgi:hypothetical protein
VHRPIERATRRPPLDCGSLIPGKRPPPRSIAYRVYLCGKFRPQCCFRLDSLQSVAASFTIISNGRSTIMSEFSLYKLVKTQLAHASGHSDPPTACRVCRTPREKPCVNLTCATRTLGKGDFLIFSACHDGNPLSGFVSRSTHKSLPKFLSDSRFSPYRPKRLHHLEPSVAASVPARPIFFTRN